MPALVAMMATLVDGIDVAFAGELKLALDAGAMAQEISFAGPGKRESELRQAVASRVLVNVESMREIALLETVSAELGLPARIALRVNPDFELKGSGMKMSGGPKPFGIDVNRCLRFSRNCGGGLSSGVSPLCGSQNLQAEAIRVPSGNHSTSLFAC